ncbi:MAG: ComEC/Rec2 family competence protein [Candidatus Delongbacteria bacterium]
MRKRPDNIALFALMYFGVFASFLAGERPLIIIPLFVVAIILFLAGKMRLLIIMFTIGVLLFQIRNNSFRLKEKRITELDGREMTVSGEIISTRNYSRASFIIFRTDSLIVEGRTIYENLNFSAFIRAVDLIRSDLVTVKGHLNTYKPSTNEFEKDKKTYFLSQNIAGEISSPKIIKIEKVDGFWRKFSEARDRLVKIFEKRLSYRAGNFISAVMLGQRENLDKGTIKDFADSGAIHLLAVSGLHVGFLVVIISFIASLINLRGWPKILVSTLILVFYAIFTGGSPSVIRAVLMAVILMLSYPLNRKLQFIDIIGTAGIISLFFEPNLVFSSGFLLSFAAVASIAVIYGPVNAWLSESINIENPFLHKIKDGLVLSFCITLGLFPFLLYMFGRYNFISIFSNVVLIPLTALIFASGILLLAVDRLELLAEFVSDITELIFFLISKTVYATNEIKVLVLNHKFDLTTTLIFSGFIIMVFYLKNIRIRTYLSFSLSALLIFKIITSQNIPAVYQFHTRHNDSSIIEHCGTNILISGKLTTNEVNNIIKPYLAGKNISKIDFFVSFEEWYNIDKVLRSLQIPVANIVTNSQTDFLRDRYNCIDIKYIGNKIFYEKGCMEFLNKGRADIKSEKKQMIIPLYKEKNEGHKIRIM